MFFKNKQIKNIEDIHKKLKTKNLQQRFINNTAHEMAETKFKNQSELVRKRLDSVTLQSK